MRRNRVTPTMITKLDHGEIFVFGSNREGMHLGGAARTALNHFGAIMGQGEGLQGESYAIPTMEGRESMKEAIGRFIDFTQKHPELHFLVTPIGCGIAGYDPEEIAPMFRGSENLENVSLPEVFRHILENDKSRKG